MPEINSSMLPTAVAGESAVRVKTYPDFGSASDIGAFRTVCDLSHMSFDDPIVFPNQPGRSHLHAFFGNTGTNAGSTASSLLAGGNSTCHGGTGNRSAYWAPSLIDATNGAPLKPRTLIVYYKQGYNLKSTVPINLVPSGLKMIAGDAQNSVDVRATNPWAGSPYVWRCVKNTPVAEGQQIPNCPLGTELWLTVVFPQCWDGINLDAPDHKSHMSYPVNGACPASHPKAIPEISMHVVYAVPAANATLKWRLASDMYDASLPAGRSAHADYVMAWRKDIIDAAVRNCVQARKDCHGDLLGDGRILY